MNTGALVVGGVALAGVLYYATRTTVEARWYHTAKHRLVDRFHYASFAAMVEAQLPKIEAANNYNERAVILDEWRNVMETDPFADLKRSGHDGYTRLAELDQGSADTLRAAYDAYEAYKVASSEWWAEFGDASSPSTDTMKRAVRAAASALDDARRVPVELPPKTSTTEDLAHDAGRGAAAVGNVAADAFTGIAKGFGKITGAFTREALGGASEQLLVLGAVALFAVFVLPRILPAVHP